MKIKTLCFIFLLCSLSFVYADKTTLDNYETTRRFDELLLLLQKRLGIMHEVGRAKWIYHLPIEDVEREKLILDHLIAKAKAFGFDEQWITIFFQRQFEASKKIQEKDFKIWSESGMNESQFLDLKRDLRPYIDQLNEDLFRVLSLLNERAGLANLGHLIPAHPLSLREIDYIDDDIWLISTSPFRGL